jgi:hypothetical protein
VLLRNPYADLGLTCINGQAAVWIGERIDRDYRIRCEWSDVSGPAHHWLVSITPAFEAAASASALPPSISLSISLGSKPPDRSFWRSSCPDCPPLANGAKAACVAQPLIGRSTGLPRSRPWILRQAAKPASARCGRPDLAVMTRRSPMFGLWRARGRCSTCWSALLGSST